ncbi:hypothetical protein JW877_07275 [bacterium]|nr:hypothetical protein [bacterium]
MQIELAFIFPKISPESDLKKWRQAFGEEMVQLLQRKDVKFKKVYDLQAFSKIINSLDRLEIPYKIKVDDDFMDLAFPLPAPSSLIHTETSDWEKIAIEIRDRAKFLADELSLPEQGTRERIERFKSIQELYPEWQEVQSQLSRTLSSPARGENGVESLPDDSGQRGADIIEIQALQLTVADITEKIANLEKEAGRESWTENYNILQDQIKELRDNVSKLGTQFQAARTALGEWEVRSDRFTLQTQEISEVKQSIADLKGQISGLHEALKAQESKTSQYINELTPLLEKPVADPGVLAELVSRLETLDNEVRDLRSKPEDKKPQTLPDLENLKALIAETEELHRKLQERLQQAPQGNRADSEFLMLKEKLKTLENDQSVLNEQIKQLHNSEEQRWSELETQYLSLQKAVAEKPDSQKSQLEKLRKQVANLEAIGGERDTKLEGLLNELADWRQAQQKAIDEAHFRFNDLGKNLDNLKNKEAESRSALDSNFQGINENIAHLEKEIDGLKIGIKSQKKGEEELEGVHERLDDLLKEVNLFREDILRIQESTASNSNENSLVHSELNLLKGNFEEGLNKLGNKFQSLSNRMEDVTSRVMESSLKNDDELSDNKKAVEKLRSNMSELKAIFEEIVENNNNFTTKIQELKFQQEEGLNELREKVKASNAKSNNFYLTLSEIAKHVEDLKKKEGAFKQLSDDFNEVMNLFNELSTKFAKVQNTLDNEVKLGKTFRGKISELENKVKSDNEILVQEMNTFNNKVSGLFTNVAGTLKRLEVIEGSIGSLNQKFEDVSKGVQTRVEEVKTINKKIEEVNSKVNRVPKLYELNERLSGQYLDLQKDYRSFLVQHKQILNDIDILREKSTQIDYMDFMELKESYRSLLQKYEQMVTKTREFQKANRSLSDEQKLLSEKLANLNIELGKETSPREMEGIWEPAELRSSDRKQPLKGSRIGRFFSRTGVGVILVLIVLTAIFFLTNFDQILLANFSGIAPGQDDYAGLQVVMDNFLNNTNGWFENNSINVKNGRYELNNINTDNPVIVFNQNWDVDDFIYEARLEKEEGNDNFLFGIIFKVQDPQNFYLLGITGSGRYIFTKRLNGSWTLIKPQEDLVPSRHIASGNQENVLKVVCRECYYELFINDHHMGVIKDETLSNGNVGFYVDKFLKVSVDYISVAELPAENEI